MPLPAPRLDDRRFQDIVDELKSRIPLHCPEWTDHNVSDPGVTLIELFAYMAEQLLYRMNRLPELHYLKFVEFLGIPIPTPQPARVPVTFWLTKPLTIENDSGAGVVIDAGTQVSTTQTETAEPLLFSIESRQRIVAPFLSAVHKSSRSEEEPSPRLDLLRLGEGTGTYLFSAQPQKDDSFYFYFENDISRHVIQFSFVFVEKIGTAIRTEQPPVIWEAYTDRHEWVQIGDVDDGTSGFNKSGKVQLHLPDLIRLTSPRGRNMFGLRVTVVSGEYKESPRLRKIEPVAALGRTIDAVHFQEEQGEFLGVSDGAPGQRFRLRHGPVILPFEAGAEELEVKTEGVSERWTYVENFAWPGDEAGTGASRTGKYFSVDVTTNEVCLPPAVKRPTGEIELYGAIPPRKAELSLTRYRHGGGAVELPSLAVNALKTSIPYVNQVQNRQPVVGGQNGLSGIATVEPQFDQMRRQDGMSLEALQLVVQRFLRSGQHARLGRAVTAEEFETLILAEFPDEVGKVECRLERSAETEMLAVYVTAKLPIKTSVSGVQDPAVSDEVRRRIDKVLYAHRLLTARVGAKSPRFVGLTVEVDLAGVRDEALERRVQAVAAAYLNPLHGGDESTGWRLNELCAKAQLTEHLRLAFPRLDIRDVRILQPAPLQTSEPAQDVPCFYLIQTCTVNFG